MHVTSCPPSCFLSINCNEWTKSSQINCWMKQHKPDMNSLFIQYEISIQYFIQHQNKCWVKLLDWSSLALKKQSYQKCYNFVYSQYFIIKLVQNVILIIAIFCHCHSLYILKISCFFQKHCHIEDLIHTVTTTSTPCLSFKKKC